MASTCSICKTPYATDVEVSACMNSHAANGKNPKHEVKPWPKEKKRRR